MELRPYQRQALADLEGGGIYADPPGTGKTATVLSWLRERWEDGEVALIVTPKVVLDQWVEQAEVWFPELTIVLGTGTPGSRARAQEEAGRLSGEGTPTALLLNYEVVRSDWQRLIDLAPDYLVCDEAHRLKNRTAKVFKAMERIAKVSGDVMFMTGTPFRNDASEVWTLLKMLNPKDYKSYWSWVRRYYYTEHTNYGGQLWRPVEKITDLRPDMLDELREELRRVMVRRPLEELMPELPPVTEVKVPLTLSAAERKLYNEMVARGWIEAGNGELVITRNNDAARLVRLRQLTSEWSQLVEAEGMGTKGHAAKELVEDLAPEQVVVMTAYRATAYALAEALGGPESGVVTYTGATPQDERTEALRAFQGGQARILVGTLGALKEAVDGLQVAHHLILLDREWTPADNEQAIARLARQGQKLPVTVYHLYAKDTTDEVVAEACITKQAVTDLVIGRSMTTILEGF